MINRRQFTGLLPLASCWIGLPAPPHSGSSRTPELPAKIAGVLASPPVIQHPHANRFSVHVAVSGLATAWVEWGWSPDELTHTAIAHHHGLIEADDRCLRIPVSVDLPSPPPPPSTGAALAREVFYRVAVQSLTYRNAYQLERGEPEFSPVYRLRLPTAEQESATVVVVNDTHENLETLQKLHQRLGELAPDALVWNGDTCNDFDQKDDLYQILLNPVRDPQNAWAAERPLLFVPGNHDIRGARARELSKALGPWPGANALPYNFSLRIGPLAIVGLDTGEDKPDNHPVFAGTAAYEPYRHDQARWLSAAVAQPELTAAPFRVAFSHIPLRGLPGDNGGETLNGYAAYSGSGARLWLPILAAAKFQAVISGHTHRSRVDRATATESLVQFVGGGPQPNTATLTLITANANRMRIEVQDLAGKSLHRQEWNS